MAGELQLQHVTGKTVYFLLRNSSALIYNTSSLSFEVYSAVNLANYKIAATEQGGSGFYQGNMPSVSEDVFSYVAKEQPGGSPAESDLTVGDGDLFWTGTVVGVTVLAIASAALTSIAQTIFRRNMSNDEASAAATSLCGAVLKLVSKFKLDESINTATVYRTDGTTPFLTQAVTKDSSLTPVKELGVGT